MRALFRTLLPAFTSAKKEPLSGLPTVAGRTMIPPPVGQRRLTSTNYFSSHEISSFQKDNRGLVATTPRSFSNLFRSVHNDAGKKQAVFPTGEGSVRLKEALYKLDRLITYISNDNFTPLDLTDRITNELMKEPVISLDGGRHTIYYSSEWSTTSERIQNQSNDIRKDMGALCPNPSLKAAIDSYPGRIEDLIAELKIIRNELQGIVDGPYSSNNSELIGGLAKIDILIAKVSDNAFMPKGFIDSYTGVIMKDPVVVENPSSGVFESGERSSVSKRSEGQGPLHPDLSLKRAIADLTGKMQDIASELKTISRQILEIVESPSCDDDSSALPTP